MKRLPLFILIALTTLSLVHGEVVNRLVMTINDEPITLYDFQNKKDLLERTVGSKGVTVSNELVLDTLTKEIIVRQEARKNKIYITEDMVDARIKQLVEGNPQIASVDQFERAIIASEGYKSLAEYKAEMIYQLTMQSLLGRVITVKEPTEAEVRAYYDENIAQFANNAPVRLRVSWVYVSTHNDFLKRRKKLQKVKDAHEVAKSGKSFATVAEEYSEDPDTKSAGGDLGYSTTQDVMNNEKGTPDAVKLAFLLVTRYEKKEGYISDVQETENGFWFVKITELERQEINYEDIRKEAKNLLYMKKAQDAFDAWVEKKLRRAAIKRFRLPN